MQETLFNSVFNSSTGTPTVDFLSLSTSLLVSLLLGLILAAAYKYRTFYTKEFVMTLTLLPTLIAMIIFMVNGNLGAGVAVAGTFSLIRFRSAAASSKELLLIFTATAIGLATGMGYLLLASCFTLFICLLLLALENSSFTKVSRSKRHLQITLPRDYDYEDLFAKNFPKHHTDSHLLSLKSQKKGQQLILEYEVEFDASIRDKAIMDILSSLDPEVEVNLTKTAQKRKTL